MCRYRWHIHAIDCVREQTKKMCSNSLESKLWQSMWSFIFDPEPFKKAANYLCLPENQQLLKAHQNSCLKQQQRAAGRCQEGQSTASAEALSYLENYAGYDYQNESYDEFVMQTFSDYKCRWMKRKLRCLFNVLQDKCPKQVILLVLGYFKQLLNNNSCDFHRLDVEHTKRLNSQSSSANLQASIDEAQSSTQPHSQQQKPFYFTQRGSNCCSSKVLNHYTVGGLLLIQLWTMICVKVNIH